MTTIGVSGGGNGYIYNIHSPATDRIYQALEDLEKQEKAIAAELENLPAKARESRTALPELGKNVGRFKKKEMQPEVLRVYEKQFRGSQLENYGMIKDAAKKELESEGLTPENRKQLFKAIEEADKRISDISAKFYETHPRGDEFRLAPGEEVGKVLLEEKFLIESRVKIISKEKKKNEAQQQQIKESRSAILDQIRHGEEELKRINAAGNPNDQAATVNTRLNSLREQSEELKNQLERLQLANEILQGQGNACVEKLNIVLQKIATAKGEKEARLEPPKFLKFVSDQLDDSSLESPAEELLDLVGAYKLGPKEGEDALTNLTVAVIATTRDVIVGGGSRWKIFKNKVIKHILPLAGIYTAIYLISTFGPTVITGLGTAVAAAKAFFITTGAVIGIANPAGAVILGIAVSGAIIYGLGLLISRNKAYIIKALTPIASTAVFLAKGLQKLYLMVKNKVSPDIHVSLKLKPLPEGSKDIQHQLEYISDQAKLGAGKAKLNNEMQGLIKQLSVAKKGVQDAQRRLQTAEIELTAARHSDDVSEQIRLETKTGRLRRDLATAKESVKNVQSQIRAKDVELTSNSEIMANYKFARIKVYQLKKLVLEFPKIFEKIQNPSTSDVERQKATPKFEQLVSGIQADFNKLKNLVGLEYAQEMMKKAEILTSDPSDDWLYDFLPDLNRPIRS